MRRNAVVTGGSSGIGNAFVSRLVREEYSVFVISRDSNLYRSCIREWSEWIENDRLTALPADLTKPDEVNEAFNLISDKTDKIDLLINNAGIYIIEDGSYPSITTLEKSIAMNCVAQYRIILHCLPYLEKSEKPIIINVTSGSGQFQGKSYGGPLAYNVSKAAATMLTLSMSYDLRGENITIHAVDPGYVRTKLNPDGTDTPENAVNGMWCLTQLYDLEKSGKFWLHGQIIPW